MVSECFCCSLKVIKFLSFFLSAVQNSHLVRLFVFGKEAESYHDEEQHKLVINDGSDLKEVTISSPSSPTNQNYRFRRISLLLYCFVGLQVSYLTWGVLQEKIMTTDYVVEKAFIDSIRDSASLTDTFVATKELSDNSGKQINFIFDLQWNNVDF